MTLNFICFIRFIQTEALFEWAYMQLMQRWQTNGSHLFFVHNIYIN